MKVVDEIGKTSFYVSCSKISHLIVTVSALLDGKHDTSFASRFLIRNPTSDSFSVDKNVRLYTEIHHPLRKVYRDIAFSSQAISKRRELFENRTTDIESRMIAGRGDQQLRQWMTTLNAFVNF